MADLVVVHAKEDLEVATLVLSALQEAGHTARLSPPDETSIDANKLHFVLLICSPAALESRDVLRKIFMTLEEDRHFRDERKLLPLCIDAPARDAARELFEDYELYDVGDLDPLLELIEQRHPADAMEDIGFVDDDGGDELPDELLDDSDEAFSEGPPDLGASGDVQSDQSRKAVEVLDGKLVHRIPDLMRIAVPQTVEVRIGASDAGGLTDDVLGGGKLVEEDLPIVETMTVELVAPESAFDIVAQTPATQLVSSDLLKGTALSQSEYGRWLWRVTPNRRGTHELVVQVSAVVADRHNVAASVVLPDKSFVVHVRVNVGASSLTAAKWLLSGLAGMLLAALVSAMTAEWWWPPIKAFLEGLR